MLAGSMGSQKLARTLVLVLALTAPSAGEFDLAAGGVVSCAKAEPDTWHKLGDIGVHFMEGSWRNQGKTLPRTTLQVMGILGVQKVHEVERNLQSVAPFV
jgi:hypothetical protein